MSKLISILATVLFGSVVIGGGMDDPRFDAKAQRTAASMRDQIKQELVKLGAHAWAGEYYAGDGTGVNTTLNLAPKTGYVFEWHGCLGLYDRNYGSITEKDGKLKLSFTFKNNTEGFRGIEPEFASILWGDRHYLVPSADIVGFCNQVNQGAEPRDGGWGRYLLRVGDEKKSVKGSPQIPSKFSEYLLAKPVEATVIAVAKAPAQQDQKGEGAKVTIDAGTKQGLRMGMELLVTKPDDLVESLKIVRVEENQSEAVIQYWSEPKVGWRLSTQARWHLKLK